jgi:hypothetical protein
VPVELLTERPVERTAIEADQEERATGLFYLDPVAEFDVDIVPAIDRVTHLNHKWGQKNRFDPCRAPFGLLSRAGVLESALFLSTAVDRSHEPHFR